MAKEPIRGWMHEPLAAILSTRAKVVVLRLLVRALTPIAYREVARRSGMAYRSCELALRDLMATGIVERISGGRERLVRFRSAHRLAPALAALLRAESDFFPALRVELRAAVERFRAEGLLVVAIIGAAARREERLDAQMEVLVVARDRAALDHFLARFDDAQQEVATRFGITIRPIGYDLDTARSMWRTRTPNATRTIEQAEIVFGPPLVALLDPGLETGAGKA